MGREVTLKAKKEYQARSAAILLLSAGLLLAGCFFGRTTTRVLKSASLAPRQVIVADVENATGRQLLVKSSLLSRLLSSGPQGPVAIPNLMKKTLTAELQAAGVEVMEQASSAAADGAPRVAVRIEGWEEASSPPYGKVVFLTASYRLFEEATDETEWEVRQERFPLRVERMDLDRAQAERLLAVAVRDALRYWPSQ